MLHIYLFNCSREMASNDPKDLTMDVSGTRCFAGFLVEVGGCVPALVLPVVSVLMPHLTGESYSFRNGVLSVLGHLLLHLSKAGSDTPTTTTSPRDQLLSKLLEHVYDTNAFVRVRVLQTMEHLVSSQVSTPSHPHILTSSHTGHSSTLPARDGGVSLW